MIIYWSDIVAAILLPLFLILLVMLIIMWWNTPKRYDKPFQQLTTDVYNRWQFIRFYKLFGYIVVIIFYFVWIRDKL